MTAPRKVDYAGRHVTLEPLDAARHASELYACSHRSAETETLWTFMGYGPFDSEFAMRAWLETCAESEDPLFFSVCDNASGERIGMVSFLAMDATARRLELGHIWYAPNAGRKRANTEAVYLMLCEAFENCDCRRVEWKCDALNEPSRKAALRLGFTYEGTFRQHMMVKGKNRDTA